MKTTKRVTYEKVVIHPTWVDDNGVVHNTPSAEDVVVYENDIDIPELTEDERQKGKTVDISFVTGAEAVGAVVGAVVKTARGELQMNTNRGIPYIGSVLGGKNLNQVSDWAAFTQNAILETNGVRGIKSFSYGIEKVGKRSVLGYNATIETDYGEAAVEAGSSTSTVREIRYQEPKMRPRVDFYTLTRPKFAHEGGGSDNAAFVYPNQPGIGRVVGIEYKQVEGGANWTSEVPDVAGTYQVRAAVETTVRYDAGYVTSDDWRFEVFVASEFTLSPTQTSGKTATLRMTASTAGGFVLWGDGDRTNVAGSGTQYATHTYADYGNYTVNVVGVTWFAIGDDRGSGATDSTDLMVTGLSMWASDLASAECTFEGCVNLVQNEIPAWPEGMESIAHCYEGCSGLGAEGE